MEAIGEIQFFQPGKLKENLPNCPISNFESKYECQNGEFELIEQQNKCEGRFGILKCPKTKPYLCNGPWLANGDRPVFCAQQSCLSLVPSESCPQPAVVDPSTTMTPTLVPSFVSLILFLLLSRCCNQSLLQLQVVLQQQALQ